jgi:flagellar biosynthesis/type III secretory pathway protein FliH
MNHIHRYQTGFIPSPANPYVDHRDQTVGPVEVPEPAVLTTRDLDRMVRAKLEDARREAAEEERRAREQAWEEGRNFGDREGREHERARLTERVQEILNRRLNHTDRKLVAHPETKKTTIAAERAFVAQIREEVRMAIAVLKDIGDRRR